FRNPAAVFLAVGVTQFFKNRKQPLLLHQLFKWSRHFDGSYLFVFPHHHFNGIARPFPDLLAYGLRHTQRMERMTVLDKRARIRNTMEGRLYRYLPLGAEFLLRI